MAFRDIRDLKEFDTLKNEKDALLVYFSTTECSVCKVLKPKVASLIEENFPNIFTAYVEINHSPELAAQNRVFVAPTIILFFGGKEYIRKNRSFSLDELKLEIERIYTRMFS